MKKQPNWRNTLRDFMAKDGARMILEGLKGRPPGRIEYMETVAAKSMLRARYESLLKTNGMLTIPEAALRFCKSRRTINRWIARGKLKVVRMSHTSVFIRPADLEAAIEKRVTSGPTPKPFKKGKTK